MRLKHAGALWATQNERQHTRIRELGDEVERLKAERDDAVDGAHTGAVEGGIAYRRLEQGARDLHAYAVRLYSAAETHREHETRQTMTWLEEVLAAAPESVKAAASQHEQQHQDEQQHAGRPEVSGVQVPRPEVSEERRDEHDDEQHGHDASQQGTVHGTPRWWLGWYDADGSHGSAHLHPQVIDAWVTGSGGLNQYTMCAVVEAASRDEARAVIDASYQVTAWRFDEPHEAGWLPGERRL